MKFNNILLSNRCKCHWYIMTKYFNINNSILNRWKVSTHFMICDIFGDLKICISMFPLAKLKIIFLIQLLNFYLRWECCISLFAFSLAINGIICCCKYIWYKVAVDFQDLFLMSNSICTVSLNIVNIIVSSIKTANCCFYCLAV